MPRAVLTDLFVRSVKPSGRQETYWCSQVPNFALRISQAGGKSFLVMVGRQRKRVHLGKYPAISVQAARQEAKRRLVDPTPSSRSLTFAEALQLYLQNHISPNTRPKTAHETSRLLSKHGASLFNRQLSDISTAQCAAIFDDLLPTPGEANHCFMAMRAFFRWCEGRRLLDRSPLQGLSMPKKTIARDRVLDAVEIARVWQASNAVAHPYDAIVQLLLLTGQRRNEITSLRWDYVDEQARTITLPASLTKNGRQHSFPYCMSDIRTCETKLAA